MQTLSFDVRGTCGGCTTAFQFTPDCIDAKRLAR